jgi:aminoglycoside phosphotransferase (APT) family kinase protein
VGDVQFSNAIFDDAGRPAAILDWEMASIGPAEMDLGWFLGLHRTTVHSHGGDLPGFPSRASIVARHERRLGRSLADLRWFEAFALLRACALFGRVLRLLAARGIDAAWMAEQNPMQGLLAGLIDGSLDADAQK